MATQGSVTRFELTAPLTVSEAKETNATNATSMECILLDTAKLHSDIAHFIFSAS